MSYYQLPNAWDPGYAIPDYVRAEPPGRGTFTTAQLPRGTISQLIPDYLAKPMVSGAPESVGWGESMLPGFVRDRPWILPATGVGLLALWLLRRRPRANPARRARRRRR